MFFSEISGLLANSSVITVSVADAGAGNITVTVIPKPKSSDTGALSAPLCLTGTTEELDAQFARLVGNYSAALQSLDEQLEAAKAVIEAAKKESATKAAKAVTKPAGKQAAGGKAAAPVPACDLDEGCTEDEEDQGESAKAEPATIDNLFA